MRLRSQAKAEQLAPSSHPGRPGASSSWGVAQPDRAALHHMQLVRTCARRLQLVATRPLAGLDTRAAAPFPDTSAQGRVILQGSESAKFPVNFPGGLGASALPFFEANLPGS
jgi:hypothetical protein